ncbi:hypothetical protein BJY52DRAFT_1195096 [Lactarius psammicola]|nr:hypothetical protein BJY52DRAFT_1195096 [Lactarius psammicola]
MFTRLQRLTPTSPQTRRKARQLLLPQGLPLAMLGILIPSTKAKAGDVPPDPQDSLLPAPPMPSQPSTGKGQARTRVLRSKFKPVAHDSGDEVFELPDADSDSLQVEPTPDLSKGLLTPLSNTLGTLDSDTWPPVSDMELFFDEFNNTDGEKMR